MKNSEPKHLGLRFQLLYFQTAELSFPIWLIRRECFLLGPVDDKLSAMKQLFALLFESFVISSRNFTLVYMLLFSLLLFGSLLNINQSPQLSPEWILYGVLMLLLFAAVMAGWFNMVAQACLRSVSLPKEELARQNYIQESLRLFQAFLPGVGQFFTQFASVYALNAAIIIALSRWLEPFWSKIKPLMMQAASLPPEQRETFVHELSTNQKLAVGEFSLWLTLAMFLFGVFWALTMLWPTYVIFYRQTGIQACLSSLLRFFKDPLRVLALIVSMAALSIPMFLLLLTGVNATGNLVVAIGLQFLNLLLQVYFAVLIFMYAYQYIGKPLVCTPSGTDPADELPQTPPHQ